MLETFKKKCMELIKSVNPINFLVRLFFSQLFTILTCQQLSQIHYFATLAKTNSPWFFEKEATSLQKIKVRGRP